MYAGPTTGATTPLAWVQHLAELHLTQLYVGAPGETDLRVAIDDPLPDWQARATAATRRRMHGFTVVSVVFDWLAAPSRARPRLGSHGVSQMFNCVGG